MRTPAITLLVSLLVACGDDGGAAPADAGPKADAPISVADAAPEADARGPTGDILADLRAIPGMTVTEQSSAPTGYRFFTMTYSQPVDHGNPGGARYNQRLSLLHKAYDAPVVMYTYG